MGNTSASFTYLPGPLSVFTEAYIQSVQNPDLDSDAREDMSESFSELLGEVGFSVEFDDSCRPVAITPEDFSPSRFDLTSIDLFEHIYLLPQDVKDVLLSYSDEFMDDDSRGYDLCARLLAELQPLGYTFDYGLSAEPERLMLITYCFPYQLKSLIQEFSELHGNITPEQISREHSMSFARFVASHARCVDAEFPVQVRSINKAGDIARNCPVDGVLDRQKEWAKAVYWLGDGGSGHTFLKLGDMFYDAECTYGVSSPLNLPFLTACLDNYTPKIADEIPDATYP